MKDLTVYSPTYTKSLEKSAFDILSRIPLQTNMVKALAGNPVCEFSGNPWHFLTGSLTHSTMDFIGHVTGVWVVGDQWQEVFEEASSLPDYVGENYSSNQEDIPVSREVESLLEYLQQKNIEIPKFAEVRNYLGSYLKLSEKLPELCFIALNEFADDSKLFLEVYHDPEGYDEHLCLFVRQKEYSRDLMKRVRKVSEVFLEKLGEVNVWFDLTSDGKPLED